MNVMRKKFGHILSWYLAHQKEFADPSLSSKNPVVTIEPLEGVLNHLETLLLDQDFEAEAYFTAHRDLLASVDSQASEAIARTLDDMEYEEALAFVNQLKEKTRRGEAVNDQ